MATRTDLLLNIERFLDSTRNWNLSRRYTASLAERTEGFTETFGDIHCRLDDEDNNDTNASSSFLTAQCWKYEQESVELVCATNHPLQPVRLFQYRPAWLEQLALRMAGIPHVVINTHYAVTEAVGPLPYLQDLASHPPAMMGRYTAAKATTTATSSSAMMETTDHVILDYLQQAHGLDLDQHLPPEQRHRAFAYQALIRQTMEPCLTVLQFTDDDDKVWSQITRPRCIKAGSSTTSSNGTLGRCASSFLAFLQAHSERVHELGRLSPGYRALSTEQALQRIRACYKVFEGILSSYANDDDLKKEDTWRIFLCGTTTPCLVDALLWDHLMHALVDVHLVVVLADFPALIAFVTNIWEEYFAEKNPSQASTSLASRWSPKDWKRWNGEQNEINAFGDIPSLVENRTKNGNLTGGDAPTFQHAIELMENLSVRDRRLHESLQVAKEARSWQAGWRKSAGMAPFQTWHRWRMGGKLYSSKDDNKSRNTRDSAREQERKLRKEYQRNDEMWMATVATGTTIAFLLLGLSNPKPE